MINQNLQVKRIGHASAGRAVPDRTRPSAPDGLPARLMIVERKSLPYHSAMPSASAAKSAKSFVRSTHQRRRIREVFEKNDRPLAADEVLQLAQQKVAGLGMATVYRTIRALTQEGWLVPVEVPGAPPRYEVRGKNHHHHFHCLSCRRLFELDGCLEQLAKALPRDFRAVDHVVLIYGFCAACDREPARAAKNIASAN